LQKSAAITQIDARAARDIVRDHTCRI